MPADSPSIPAWRLAVVASLALITLLLCHWARPLSGETVAGVNLSLPDRVGNWWGIDQEPSQAERTILPSDTEFARKDYHGPDNEALICSIVLSGANKASIHRPEICLPAQGWTIESGQVLPIELHSGHSLRVMALSLHRPIPLASGREKTLHALFIYWFVGDGVTTPNHWRRIWLTSWDRIFHHINHRWAYVFVLAPVTAGWDAHGKDAAETLDMMKAFVADAVPSFQKDEMR